jgi:hypothetical protein
MELSEMQRLKQLEDENRRLKHIVAEQMGLLGVIIKHVALNQETHELAERQLNALREKRPSTPDATPARV